MTEQTRLKSVFEAPRVFESIAIIVYLISVLLQFTAGEMPWYRNGIVPLYLLSAVQLIPIAIVIRLGKLNYLSVILLSHFMTYSLAKLNFMKLNQQDYLGPDSIFTIQQQTICTIIMTVAYFSFNKLTPFNSRSKKVSLPWFNLKTCYRFLIVQLIYELLPKNSLTGSPVAIFMMQYFVAFTTLSALHISNWAFMRIVIMQVFIGILCYLYYGSLGVLIANFSFIMLAMLLHRRYAQSFAIGVPLVLAVAVIQANKNAYRTFIWSQQETSFSEKASFFITGFIDTLQGKKQTGSVSGERLESDDAVLGDAISVGFSRVGDDSLERVLTMTPSVVPFWMGESYEFLFYFLVPRVLFPNKPTRTIWHEFGQRYQYLNTDDDITSISLTYFAEAYMNFGFIGLYSIALLIGVLISLSENFVLYLGRGQITPEYLILLKPFEFLEIDSVTMITSIIMGLVAVFLSKSMLSSLNRSFEIFAEKRQYA